MDIQKHLEQSKKILELKEQFEILGTALGIDSDDVGLLNLFGEISQKIIKCENEMKLLQNEKLISIGTK